MKFPRLDETRVIDIAGRAGGDRTFANVQPASDVEIASLAWEVLALRHDKEKDKGDPR